MAKKTKNISLDTVHQKAFRMFHSGKQCEMKTVDLSTRWMPVPHDIQISLHQMKVEKDEINSGMFHQRFVLKIHLDGISKGYVGNKLLTFRPGEGILVFPFQPHRITETPDEKGQFRLLANFTLSREDQSLLEPLRGKIISFSKPEYEQILRMLRCMDQPESEPQREAVFALSSLLILLIKKRDKVQHYNQDFPKNIQTAFDFIYRHYRENPNLKEIAFQLGMSVNGFRQMFLRETGRLPGTFIRELRLKNAAEKLRYTRLPIQEISRQCGFATPFAFSRAFRSFFRLSPREFRKK